MKIYTQSEKKVALHAIAATPSEFTQYKFLAFQKEPIGNIFTIKCATMAILHVNILIPPQPTQLI